MLVSLVLPSIDIFFIPRTDCWKRKEKILKLSYLTITKTKQEKKIWKSIRMDSSSRASPNNSDLTHLARVWISGLSIARIDPARVLYIACMINPGSIWIGYHQMKIVFYFYFYFCCIHKYQCRDSQKPANVIITKWLRSNRHWDLWVTGKLENENKNKDKLFSVFWISSG